MNRPLLFVCVLYIIGIIIGVYCKSNILLLCCICILLVIFILIKILERKKDKNKLRCKKIQIIKKIIVAIIAITLIGIFINNINEKYNNKYIKYNDKDINVIGTIDDVLKEDNSIYKCTIIIDSVNNDYSYDSTKLLIRTKINKDESINKKIKDKLHYGNKIKVKIKYKEPNIAKNYKGFDYKQYLKTEGIYGIAEINNIDSIKVIKKDNMLKLKMISLKIFNKIEQQLDLILPKEEADIAKGILLGDDENVSEEILESFRDSNLLHMLAVSGTHVAYVILLISIIVNKKIFGSKKASLIKIFLLILFIFITGETPSVMRAGITVIIYIIAKLLYKKPDVITAICVSVLITLIKNPFNIFNVGMQLSYSGTLGIILFYNIIYEIINKRIYTFKHKKIEKIKQFILKSIIVSISANIFIIPIMIYNFNTISLTFIISNLLAGPVLGISIMVGFILIIISMISLKISLIISFIFKYLLQLLIYIADISSKIPLSKIIVVTPNIIFIILIDGALLCMYLIYTKKKNANRTSNYFQTNKRNSINKYMLVIMLTIYLLCIICSFYNIQIQDFTIHFVDQTCPIMIQ